MIVTALAAKAPATSKESWQPPEELVVEHQSPLAMICMVAGSRVHFCGLPPSPSPVKDGQSGPLDRERCIQLE